MVAQTRRKCFERTDECDPSMPWGCGMPIGLISENDHAFTPEDAKILIAAFEDTLRALNLANRDDPLTLMVARVIIELAKEGERDPVRMRDGALKAIRGSLYVPRTSSALSS